MSGWPCLRSDGDGIADDARHDMDVALLEQLARCVDVHRLPLMTLASGRTTLADKFASVVHAVMLESGWSVHDLSGYLDSICTTTTDFGVEYGLRALESRVVRWRMVGGGAGGGRR